MSRLGKVYFRDQPAHVTLRFNAPNTAFRTLFDYGYIRLRLEQALYDAWAQGGFQGTNVVPVPTGTNEVLILGNGAYMANLALNAMAKGPLPDYKELTAKYGERFQAQDMQSVQSLPAGILGPVKLVGR
jgi:hypothetical protein